MLAREGGKFSRWCPMADNFDREHERERKSRNRRRKILCDFRICNGELSQCFSVVFTHIQRFGRRDPDNVNEALDANNDFNASCRSRSVSPEISDELYLADSLQSEDVLSLTSGSDDEPLGFADDVELPVSEGELSLFEHVERPCIDKEINNEDQVDFKPAAGPQASYEDSLFDTDRVKIPLHNGSEITVLEALYCYFLWFTEHPGVSKSSLSDMLKVNPKCIRLPGTIYPHRMKKQ